MTRETMEGNQVFWHVMHNEKRMQKIANAQTARGKMWSVPENIVVAACRECKVKLSDAEISHVAGDLIRALKESA